MKLEPRRLFDLTHLSIMKNNIGLTFLFADNLDDLEKALSKLENGEYEQVANRSACYTIGNLNQLIEKDIRCFMSDFETWCLAYRLPSKYFKLNQESLKFQIEHKPEIGELVYAGNSLYELDNNIDDEDIKPSKILSIFSTSNATLTNDKTFLTEDDDIILIQQDENPAVEAQYFIEA